MLETNFYCLLFSATVAMFCRGSPAYSSTSCQATVFFAQLAEESLAYNPDAVTSVGSRDYRISTPGVGKISLGLQSLIVAICCCFVWYLLLFLRIIIFSILCGVCVFSPVILTWLVLVKLTRLHVLAVVVWLEYLYILCFTLWVDISGI